MKIRTWEIGGEEGIREIPHPTSALEPDPLAVPRWSELAHGPASELAAAVTPLQLHPSQLEELLNDSRSNRISIVGDTLLLEFPCAVEIDHDPHPYVSFIARPKRLVTVLHSRGADRRRLIERMRYYLVESEAGIELVVTQLLGDLVDESMEVAAGLRARTRDLTTRVQRAPLDVSLEEIQSVTREVQHAALIAEDQLFSLDALSAGLEDVARFPRTVAELNQLRLQLSHILSLASRLTENLRSLHAHAASARSDVDSAHLRTLTVISAIFLPLNLIAGIYGMNFVHDAQHPWNMPELGWRYGYLAALGAMTLVAATLLMFFRRRGWLGRARRGRPARSQSESVSRRT